MMGPHKSAHAAWCCVLLLATLANCQSSNDTVSLISNTTVLSNATTNSSMGSNSSSAAPPLVKAALSVQDILETTMKQCTWDGYQCQFFINYAWAIVRPANMTTAGLADQKDVDDMAGFYMWGCTVHRDRGSCLGDKYHHCVWEKSTNSCWVDVGFTQSYMAKNYMCTDNDISLFTRCALVPTPDACVATWGCRVMPDARRLSRRRLQGESQVPACVPWWFLQYTEPQQEEYLGQVDDPSAQVWKPCPNARFAYAYKTACDLDSPAACNVVPHCTWRDSAFKCTIQDQGVLAFWYKSPENAVNLVQQARTCVAITNWKRCDQLVSAPTRVTPPLVMRPPKPPPPPPKNSLVKAAGVNGGAASALGTNVQNVTTGLKMTTTNLTTKLPDATLAGAMSKASTATTTANAAAQNGARAAAGLLLAFVVQGLLL